jgi:hypothetical protein
MKISLDNLKKIANELIDLKEKAVISDNFEEGKYYCYWLIKAFGLLKDYLPSEQIKYDKMEFEVFFEYILIDIVNITQFQRNMPIYKSSLVNLLKLIDEKIDSKYLKEDSENFLNDIFFLWQSEELNILNAYEILYGMTELLIDYISKNQVMGIDSALFMLYKLSILEYLKIIIYMLLIEEANSQEIYVQVLNSVIRGLKCYPLNYLLFDIASRLMPNDEQGLNYNHIGFCLEGFMELGKLETGNRYNEKKQYEEAEKFYQEGLFTGMPNSRDMFYYSIAKNIYDYMNNNKTFNMNIASVSNRNAILAIYYSKININNNYIFFWFKQKLELQKPFLNLLMLRSYNIIGLNMARQQNSPEAINTYTNAINKVIKYSELVDTSHLKDEIGNLYANRGFEYFKTREYNNALKDLYLSLTFLSTNLTGSYLKISACYYYMHDYDNMISVLQRMLGLNIGEKEKCDAYYSLVLAYNMKDDIDNVKKYAKNYTTLHSDDRFFYCLLGQVYLKTGYTKQARHYFNLACQKEDPSAYYYSSIYFLNNREIKKAKEYFRKYLEVSKKELENNYKKFYTGKHINYGIIYKYRGINKHTIQMLIDNYIYFSDIENLNDPFDCRLVYEYSTKEAFKDVFNQFGLPKIMSLSASHYDNGLLWSHYTDMHSGLSIGYEFNIQEMIKRNVFLFPVNYTNELKEMDMALFSNMKTGEENVDAGIKVSLLNSIVDKKDDWKYEKEHRAINFYSNKIPNGDMVKIKRIVFGCKTSKTDIKTIINIFRLKSNDYCVENRTKLIGNSVDIEFNKLKRSDSNLYNLDEDLSFEIEEYLL